MEKRPSHSGFKGVGLGAEWGDDSDASRPQVPEPFQLADHPIDFHRNHPAPVAGTLRPDNFDAIPGRGRRRSGGNLQGPAVDPVGDEVDEVRVAAEVLVEG